MKIEDIKNPTFLKEYDEKKLKILAEDIRSFLIDNISQTGGHLSSNLGIVELTIALHKVFNAPDDKIFFDVGHQSYVHKILTGRANDFPTLRSYNGLSGYQKRSESVYDCFEAGHSSTTISAATGMAIARDLDKQQFSIVPVIGDGALTGGLVYEALNHLGHLNKKVIIVLNDNDMSISHNVGSMNSLLDRLRISMPYNKAKQNYKDILKTSKVGHLAYKVSKKVRDCLKKSVISNIFIELGFDYLGPLDGHDFHDLLRGLNKAKNISRPIVVHVLTTKGKGYKYAEEDINGKWHGTGKFDKETGIIFSNNQPNEISFSQALSDLVYEEMKVNKDIVAITPAMISGSKLERIFEDFKDKSFDVGIAEGHATMMAAGLSLSGKHPFISIYSTFSQRSYDQFNHDLARMNLPAFIGLDRSGLVGEDGDTHHGVFDISMFRNLPNFIISAPKDYGEMKSLVKLGFQTKAPFILRYPRGNTFVSEEEVETTIGTWKILKDYKNKVLISYGVHSLEFQKRMSENTTCGLIHALFIKPLDYQLLDKLFKNNIEILIYEPDIKGGGFASSILEYANQMKYDTRLVKITSIDDIFIPAGNTATLLKVYNLDYDDFINSNCL